MFLSFNYDKILLNNYISKGDYNERTNKKRNLD